MVTRCDRLRPVEGCGDQEGIGSVRRASNAHGSPGATAAFHARAEWKAAESLTGWFASSGALAPANDFGVAGPRGSTAAGVVERWALGDCIERWRRCGRRDRRDDVAWRWWRAVGCVWWGGAVRRADVGWPFAIAVVPPIRCSAAASRRSSSGSRPRPALRPPRSDRHRAAMPHRFAPRVTATDGRSWHPTIRGAL